MEANLKRFIIGIIAALALAACSSAQVQQFKNDVAAIEARAADAVARLRAGIAKFNQNVPTYVAEAKQLASAVCAVNGLLGAGVAEVQANVSSPPPTAQKLLNGTLTYNTKIAQGCGAFQQTQASVSSGSQAVDLGVGVWNAYQAGKQNLTAAQSAIAKGQ